MNPSSSVPQSTDFPFQNPNPNPDSSSTPNPSDLSITLSSLNSLISFCDQTLQNSNILPPKLQNDKLLLLPCPYNPHHLMPPESLFSHTLRCPFPLDIGPPPNYHNTLQSSSGLNHQNTHFTIQDHNQDLCFPLDEYLSNAGSTSFFYQDCPAAVALSDVDATSNSASKRGGTLPGILSIECADIVCFSDGDAKKKFDGWYDVGFRVLGSDLWYIRREVENWRDYEYLNMYSFNVLRAILGLRMVKVSDLSKLVIVNSPRFGVVIDVYMRDHLSLLLGLCLKAVIREAMGFLDLVKGQESERDLKSMSFTCPRLKQVLMWLASQLSILYGQVGGKCFSIEIFKQCILESASSLLLPSEQCLHESSSLKEADLSLLASPSDTRDAKIEKPPKRNANCGLDESVGGTVRSKMIFVSHVAAAAAALHERSWLEEKIKALRGLRVSQPLMSYQRMAQSVYISNRADEERKKRPNYRPIIEHDGLPQQRSSNQESSKTKTREELLAEERDYKRRRMSYRGKKVKRTTLQVVRDIIEEYMDEIKEAGGIGCFEKGDQAGRTLPSKPPTLDVRKNADSDYGKSGDSDLLEGVRGSPNFYEKQTHDGHDTNFTSIKDALTRDGERYARGLHGQDRYLQEQGKFDREKHVEYYSRSAEKHRSRDRSNHRRKREDMELTGTKHRKSEHRSSGSSKYHDFKPYFSASNSHQRHRHAEQNAESLTQNVFGDRYDPSESQNIDDNSASDGDRYIKPEELRL